MNKEVKISVIVPVYNVGKYIARCARSLFDQTWEDIEYIFIDDCSLDDSIAVLKQVLENYPARKQHIKIIRHQENRGVATARNTGLDVATGKYIGWVDADDWVEPDIFERLYAVAAEENTDIVCSGHFIDFKQNRQMILPVDYNRKQFMKALITGEVQGMLWNKLFRRDVFEKQGIRFLRGNNMAEDRNVLFKFLFYANSVRYVQQAYYHYVQASPTAMTRDSNPIRVYEEINNDSDVVQFIASHQIDFISDEDVLRYKLKSKKKLLFSKEIVHFKCWPDIFPESNNLLWKSQLPFRHKILAFCALNQWWLFIRLWINLKQNKAKK